MLFNEFHPYFIKTFDSLDLSKQEKFLKYCNNLLSVNQNNFIFEEPKEQESPDVSEHEDEIVEK
jgi:hypothetical protein